PAHGPGRGGRGRLRRPGGARARHRRHGRRRHHPGPAERAAAPAPGGLSAPSPAASAGPPLSPTCSAGCCWTAPPPGSPSSPPARPACWPPWSRPWPCAGPAAGNRHRSIAPGGARQHGAKGTFRAVGHCQRRWEMGIRRARAVVAGTVLVASMLLGAALAPAGASSGQAGSGGGAFRPGAPGVGDEYFPLYGNGGYDVRHYLLKVSYDPATDRLAGVATISATATQNLSRFNLDFVGLTVRSIKVNGRAACWSRTEHELTVTPRHGLKKGRRFTVVVRYDGGPITQEIVLGPGFTIEAGFIHTDDGAIVAGQPEGAARWFPVNDHSATRRPTPSPPPRPPRPLPPPAPPPARPGAPPHRPPAEPPAPRRPPPLAVAPPRADVLV